MPIFITVFCENCYKLTKCQTIKIFQFGGRKKSTKEKSNLNLNLNLINMSLPLNELILVNEFERAFKIRTCRLCRIDDRQGVKCKFVSMSFESSRYSLC